MWHFTLRLGLLPPLDHLGPDVSVVNEEYGDGVLGFQPTDWSGVSTTVQRNRNVDSNSRRKKNKVHMLMSASSRKNVWQEMMEMIPWEFLFWIKLKSALKWRHSDAVEERVVSVWRKDEWESPYLTDGANCQKTFIHLLECEEDFMTRTWISRRTRSRFRTRIRVSEKSSSQTVVFLNSAVLLMKKWDAMKIYSFYWIQEI